MQWSIPHIISQHKYIIQYGIIHICILGPTAKEEKINVHANLCIIHICAVLWNKHIRTYALVHSIHSCILAHSTSIRSAKHSCTFNHKQIYQWITNLCSNGGNRRRIKTFPRQTTEGQQAAEDSPAAQHGARILEVWASHLSAPTTSAAAGVD